MFLHVNDGTGPQHLQVIVPQPLAETVDATFGSCVEVKGVLKESPGKGQRVELLSSSVEVVGPCDPFEFPVKQRARHSPQYTRDYLHLRPKSNIFSALLRIRNVASMAIHSFFQNEGFLFIHTPILVTNDCEGGCEVFKVEPLFTGTSNSSDSNTDIENEESDDICTGPPLVSKSNNTILVPSSRKDRFFGQPVYLTVSGQLHLEVMTGALTKVYNFGPCFRAENSHGSFHLSEFYMVEAELAFISHLADLLVVMEKLVKYVHQTVMHSCPEDVALFSKFVAPPGHKDSVSKMMESDFESIAEEVCGTSKGGKKIDKETWWWSEEVQTSIKKKKEAFKNWQREGTDQLKEVYKEKKKEAKTAVSKAKEEGYKEWYKNLDIWEGEKTIYRITKQRAEAKRDIKEIKVIKDQQGEVLTDGE
ncbi:asparagine--tRNA ligase [Elysia marginata]|uniref:Asparagine--tRNA ligase n=1 Tax=Elysia marginata TaxID=1093978 RepID=A0AAV4FI36_9GAST|nr:asparagine--tRNA ligase [Elysia marginata]